MRVVRQVTAWSDPVVERWGEVAYDEALARQLELHARRLAGTAPDTLVLVTHSRNLTVTPANR